jgi:nicotinate phosphoribosyltransferase
VRKLPPERNFHIAAGLEQAIDYLTSLQFTPEELAWLAETQRFMPAFLDSLRGLRFTGDVDAMPEGTPRFPDEPLLRVTAPLREAQLVESRLLNIVHYATMTASKAARCTIAAPGRTLVDFAPAQSAPRGGGAGVGAIELCGRFRRDGTVEAGRRFGRWYRESSAASSPCWKPSRSAGTFERGEETAAPRLVERDR